MKNFSAFILIVLVILGLSSFFIIDEGQRGIVIQFGKVKRDAGTDSTTVYEPGLHFKIPLIEKVRKLDARIQTLDDAPARFVNAEKKDLMVDSYVKWRIDDFAKYYLSTGGFREQAESLLRQKVNNGLRTEFGTRTIQEIVSGQRSELLEEALEQSSKSSGDLGIEILDVRVKQINLPREVSNSIYKRMRAERTAVAKEHRSEGKEKAEVIRADVDARVTVMLADAQKNALIVRGTGDAEAAKIYANAYGKNPEFFSFVRSLDAYKNSFKNKSDILVLEPESEFFDYMKNPGKAK